MSDEPKTVAVMSVSVSGPATSMSVEPKKALVASVSESGTIVQQVASKPEELPKKAKGIEDWSCSLYYYYYEDSEAAEAEQESCWLWNSQVVSCSWHMYFLHD